MQHGGKERRESGVRGGEKEGRGREGGWRLRKEREESGGEGGRVRGRRAGGLVEGDLGEGWREGE